ncbi:MAG TPA: DMT family transporter [Ilumatobacteraceae bacterium]|nr:DMT family transporter [Ilumatobacteraceae bacterium]
MTVSDAPTVVVDRTRPPATLAVRLSLLTIVLFFGGSLPAYKLASESFGPATTNLIRFILATIMLVIIARNRLPTARQHVRHLILVGMFGIGLMAVFMGIGVDRGSATIGSIVVGLEPVGVALAGVLLVGDTPTRRSIVALVVGFAGALVASGVFTENSGPSPVLPIILLLGTVVAFSIYTAFVRRVGRGVDPLAVAAVTQVGALFFVIPACLFDVLDRGMLRGDSITPKAAGAAVFLGIGSGIAYLLLCLVLSNVPSNRVAVTLFLTPAIGVLVSWLVVGEHLHLRDGVGGALVLLAVWISERSQR